MDKFMSPTRDNACECQLCDDLRRRYDQPTMPDLTQHADCVRPRRGPLYWDWRCLNCDRPISAHRSWWRRLLSRGLGGSDQ